jgi:hypothetical protein
MSTWLELQAIKMAVTQTRQRANGPTRLVLAVDSQAAVALTKKRYSTKSEELNTLCDELDRLLFETQVALVATWVPRTWNWRADELSHPEDWTSKQHKWTSGLWPRAFADMPHAPALITHTPPFSPQVDNHVDQQIVNDTQLDSMEQVRGTGSVHQSQLLISS